MNIQQILGITCIGLSVWMAVASPNRDLDILTCNRSSQICNVKRLSWRGEEKASIPIIDLREAEVERRKKNNRVVYLLVLYTDRERFPVTFNGSITKKESFAARVNSFIATSSDNGFSEQVEKTLWAKWVFVAIIAGLGVKALGTKDGSRRV